jgi:hypothetical protein
MQAETTGLDFVKAAATQLRRVNGWTLIAQQNLKTIGELGSARRYSLAI